MTATMNPDHMTENQLKAEAERLRKRLNAGEATPSDAQRYQTVRAALYGIQRAKQGKSLW